MMRRCFLVFGLLAIACLLGTSTAVVPSQAGRGCASCGPVVNSRSGSSLAPIPENGAVSPNR